MADHTNANVCSETPHLSPALKRRARALISDNSLDAGTRSVLRYGLETEDPLLAGLTRRVEAGENIIDDRGFLQIKEDNSTAPNSEHKSAANKALT
jgi:hypothetical protein